ncbi:unnamed protein product (macronuclear) [Paramecium tetraurelia]|uniref:Uncharacterized protein n=1 Tax=Paramecium tetraurelia TaxID=5888 RepID=A0DG49_PARTE|nr:uncharacterized protein GSPATT00002144001 [Paramecium tetraurelia]CAK82016.1 unnamed protein product [Paramecium tetraurelia]|eukprot:XP_001449413.1 hypothetical protein (macronuclear) [Paramecium tetraurelia strain d4-2]
MNNRPKQYQVQETVDDLVYSQYTGQSLAQIRPSDQIKSMLQPCFQNSNKNQTEQDEYTDSLNQYSKAKAFNQQQENQLLKQVQHLNEKLLQQQQEFFKKEMQFQDLLMQVQQEHEKLMKMAKQKYDIAIEGLKKQLKQKDDIIYDLNIKLRVQKQLKQKSEKNLLGLHSKKSSLVTADELDSEATCTVRTLNIPTRSSTSQPQNDDQLLSLYRNEIDKLKYQTFEFAQKFESEKRTIKDEICLLKNQKLLLQTLLSSKQSPQSDRKLAKSEGKTFSKQRKHHNSSTSMPKSSSRQQLNV